MSTNQFYMVTKDNKGAFSLKRIPFIDGTQAVMSKKFKSMADDFLAPTVKKTEYIPTWTANKDELSYIDKFALPKLQDDAENKPTMFADIKPPFSIKNETAKSIMMVDTTIPKKTRFYFQWFTQAKIIQQDSLVFFTLKGYTEADREGFSISNRIDAVIDDGKLYFKSFNLARQFLELDPYFTEASDDQIKLIAKHPKLHVGDIDLVISHLNTPIRRKFHHVITSSILDHAKVTPEYVKKISASILLDLDIKVVGGTRVIDFPQEKNKIERLLGLLSDDIYESILTGSLRHTNSHKALVLPTAPVAPMAKTKKKK